MALGNDDEVSIICFPHEVLEGWYGLRRRLEYYTPLKKALFCSLKVCTLKKIAAAHILAALHTVKHGLYTSNLLPTPMELQTEIQPGEDYDADSSDNIE